MSRVRSMRACGPSTGPTACALAGRRCSLWGWRKGDPGGVPSTVVRGAWCQALSLPRLPVLWSGQPGFRDPCVPGAVDAGVWTQHRPHSVRPCGPVLLAVGVAEGRPRGGVLSTVVRGAWCQALSLPWPPVLWSGQLKVLPWVVDGAGGLGAGKTSGAGTRGVDLNAAVGGRTGYTDTNGGESSNNGSKIHVDCYPAENPSL